MIPSYFQRITPRRNQSTLTWLTKLKEKQQNIQYHRTYEQISLSKSKNSYIPMNYIERTSNLQHVISHTILSNSDAKWSNGKLNKGISFRPLEDLSSEESAFVLLLKCLLKVSNPKSGSASNKNLNTCISNLKLTYEVGPALTLNDQDLAKSLIFGNDLPKILRDDDFKLSIQFLRKKLGYDYSVDDILKWMNSLFEPSMTTALQQIIRTKTIPNSIMYDMLLRNPQNELEYQYLMEIYKSNYQKLNLIDQEKFHQLQQFSKKFNRSLIVPPVFMNLFQFALRNQPDDLPKLVELFLESNSLPDENTLRQLGEISWYLSIDHTGEFIGKPSRNYYIAQSMIIKSINEIIQNNKSLETDITTILSVSNLSYYKNPSKAYKLFKTAKQQFDHWKIQSFKPENFERILPGHVANFNLDSNELIEDFNMKFLCNSIILLNVNKDNHLQIIADLRDIFTKIESKILSQYPEIWKFILVKLSYHQMISGPNIKFLIDGYYTQINNYGRAYPYVLDVLIKDSTSFHSIQTILENVSFDKFDENNIAHLISKLYKFGPGKLSGEYQYIETIQLARDLYKKAPFKSLRINSSYILGESVITPVETYDRYISMNKNFKVSRPLTISALFISIIKMVHMDIYHGVKWGGEEPVEFALKEFDTYISKTFNDGLNYPNDHLLGLYIDVIITFGKQDRLYGFLDKLLDLKYPVGENLFQRYLNGLSTMDSQELVKCLNEYNENFHSLRECKNDYELNIRKKKLPVVSARGQFRRFVEYFQINWGIISKWKWPSKKKY